MEEKNLLKLALVVSFTGLLLLIIILENIEIKEYNIKDLTKEHIDKDIKIKGTIARITETPGLYIINIKDQTGEITGIIFKEESLNLTLNQKVEIWGSIVEYKNILEIQIDELKSTN